MAQEGTNGDDVLLRNISSCLALCTVDKMIMMMKTTMTAMTQLHSANLCMMVFPTAVDPVKPTFLTSGWLDNASPVTEPGNGQMETLLAHYEIAAAAAAAAAAMALSAYHGKQCCDGS